MFSLNFDFKKPLSAPLWDLLCGLLFQNDVQGIDEGIEPAPEGGKALVAGTLPEDADEFAQAIAPGLMTPPQAFKAYFETEERCFEALNLLLPHLDNLEFTHSVDEVETGIDYSESWKVHFKPLFCKPDWMIRAPWHTEEHFAELKIPADLTLREIIIEPGMAFGTGNHETTRGCLYLMSDCVATLEQNGLKPEKLLDFGCGSGILAIAAKKLPFGYVRGVDIDPLALEASLENAKRNSVELEVSLSVPEGETYDCIIANILKNTLLDFSRSFHTWLKPGGALILSGLLLEQEKEILGHFETVGFKLLKRNPDAEWISLSLTKN